MTLAKEGNWILIPKPKKQNSSDSYGKKGLEIMPSGYTLNHKGAIISLLFAAIWALVSIIIAIDMGLQSNLALAIFGMMTLIAWILVPLYVKRIKSAFILGIVLLVSGLIGLLVSPGNPPWYSFTNPVSIVKELSFVMDSLFGLYFSVKSYTEL